MTNKPTTIFVWDTVKEARAFLDGVEWVNDTSFHAWIDPNDPRRIFTREEDDDGDTTHPTIKRLTIRHPFDTRRY